MSEVLVHELYAHEHQLVSDCLSEASDVPVAKDWSLHSGLGWRDGSFDFSWFWGVSDYHSWEVLLLWLFDWPLNPLHFHSIHLSFHHVHFLFETSNHLIQIIDIILLLFNCVFQFLNFVYTLVIGLWLILDSFDNLNHLFFLFFLCNWHC